jgi:dihydrofolate synthase/folylpolyglutamate synthase
MGMLKEKDWKQMARILAPIAREVVCVPPQGNRALNPQELAEHLRDLGVEARVFSSITEGFESLLAKASSADVILAAGSLYMIGPVRRACGLSEDEA